MRQSRSPSPQMLKANPRGSVSTHHVNRANRVQNGHITQLSVLYLGAKWKYQAK